MNSDKGAWSQEWTDKYRKQRHVWMDYNNG